MSNKKTNPTQTEVSANGLDEAKSLVEQLQAIVGLVPALSKKTRARSVKLRKGGETVIPTVAALSEKFGLNVASHPTTTMVEKAKKAHSLIPLQKQLITATKQVSDQMFSANSESWVAATVHYSMLKRLSRTNGDLEAALAPVEQFFKQRSASVVAAEKAAKAERKAAKAAKAAAKAAAAIDGTHGAPAPGSPSITVTPVVPSVPVHTAAPVTPVSSSVASA